MPRVPDDHDLAIAAFRHRLIAEALEADGEAIVTILKTQAGQPRTDPQGRAWTWSVRTLSRWLAAYRGGGFVALCPKRRRDQGALRAITPDVFARAQALRREKERSQHERPCGRGCLGPGSRHRDITPILTQEPGATARPKVSALLRP